jgi:hypothetical protein
MLSKQCVLTAISVPMVLRLLGLRLISINSKSKIINIINQINSRFLIALVLLGCLSVSAHSQTVRLDNGKIMSIEEVTLERLTCHSLDVQFSRGMRWDSPDFKPTLMVIDRKRGIDKAIHTKLEAGCHSDMMCVRGLSYPALAIVTTACGGNAVPDQYRLYNLNNLGSKILSEFEISKLGLR